MRNHLLLKISPDVALTHLQLLIICTVSFFLIFQLIAQINTFCQYITNIDYILSIFSGLTFKVP